MPPIDKDNEQFVIFVRSKKGLKRWVPINVITAGTQANLLVKGLEARTARPVHPSLLLPKHNQPLFQHPFQTPTTHPISLRSPPPPSSTPPHRRRT